MTSTLFAFPNLLRCPSWPVLHEKCSRACPALVLPAGRAEKLQLLMVQQAWSCSKHRLFCTSKKPWTSGAKGRAELAATTTLQWERARESQGTSGALEVVQEQQARLRPKWPRGALTGGCAQCCREAASPEGQPWGSPWECRRLRTPGAGHEGHLGGA